MADETIEEHLQAHESTDGQAIANVASQEVRGMLDELPSELQAVVDTLPTTA
jgi:hypothetical protein